jgi:membrane protein DedA with SNARE-associated domain
MLLAASVTGSLVALATRAVRHLGLAGVATMTFASGVIGVPGTEAPMLFAGFNVYQGHLTLVGIIAFGMLGDLLGATAAYAIGYFGLHELLERKGAVVHVSGRRLELAHAWFARFGAPVIFVSRLVPLLRAAFPYAAGVARMAYWRFILLATLGSALWIAGLGLLGRAVGSSWQSWRHNLDYVDYAALALLVCAVGYLILRRRRERGRAPV